MTVMVNIKCLNKEVVVGGKKVSILRDINCSFNKGEFVAIMGASGSGKSTFLSLLAGLDRPTSGEIIVNDEDICDMSEKKLAEYRNKNIGIIFQNFNLISSLNAEENILVPMYLNQEKVNTMERVHELLHLTGMTGKGKQTIGQLSGGEQQRISIARALSCYPKILLADEPTGALDSENGNMIMNLFRKLNKELSMTIIMVTHESHIANMADRILIMKDGQMENN